MPQPRLRSPLHNLRGQTIICPPMGIEPRLLRFYAGALTARPLALVAEWLSEQQILLPPRYPPPRRADRGGG